MDWVVESGSGKATAALPHKSHERELLSSPSDLPAYVPDHAASL
ncbi:hypothetical protein GCM10023335_66670 [Streptomyces siamensis]|uniref:Uncharacterized protein n=1 Tax=Streptomyces siamensis TaxID=1274986 RepID=A0ABP9JDK0_9ACTN